MNLDIISAEENLRREIKKMNLELVDANSVHEPFNHAVKTSWPDIILLCIKLLFLILEG